MCGAGDDASYVRFGETKDKYFNRPLRHGTEWGTEICVLIRYITGSIGTGAMLVPGFGTQPYSYSNHIAIYLASQPLWIVTYLNQFSTGSRVIRYIPN